MRAWAAAIACALHPWRAFLETEPMRRRNPPSRNRRRRGGPPPWPSTAMIQAWRAILVLTRGCPLDTPPAEIARLAQAKGWRDGLDITRALDGEIVRRMLDPSLTPPPLRLARRPRRATGG